MGGSNASKTPDQGADTPVYLARTDDELVSGGFYAERTLYGFENGPWKPLR